VYIFDQIRILFDDTNKLRYQLLNPVFNNDIKILKESAYIGIEKISQLLLMERSTNSLKLESTS